MHQAIVLGGPARRVGVRGSGSKRREWPNGEDSAIPSLGNRTFCVVLAVPSSPEHAHPARANGYRRPRGCLPWRLWATRRGRHPRARANSPPARGCRPPFENAQPAPPYGLTAERKRRPDSRALLEAKLEKQQRGGEWLLGSSAPSTGGGVHDWRSLLAKEKSQGTTPRSGALKSPVPRETFELL